jgi:hypothetical protein
MFVLKTCKAATELHIATSLQAIMIVRMTGVVEAVVRVMKTSF